MAGLADKARAGAQGPAGKVFYPSALVGLAVVMETGRPPEGLELHPRFGGLVRRFNNSVFVPARPSALKVVRNSYNKPDSFHVEFDARMLPIAPKQIRAAAVELFLWNAPYLGAPVPQDAQGNVLLKPLLAGLVDDVASEYGDSGHTVSLDGQDYTALFTGREWDPRRRSPSGLRLDVQLEQLVREGDPGGVTRLRVEPESLKSSLPIVGSTARRTNKKGQPVKEKSSFWDVTYRMAQMHGFILFVEGMDVVLTKPHVLAQARAGLLRLPSESTQPIRRFAWGRNLTRLEVQRHMGKEINPQIEVRSYDERTRQTYAGRYPAKGQKAATGVGTERDQVKLYQVNGITSEVQLREIARTVYDLIARGEQTVHIGTNDLVDLHGNDLLTMRTGDAAAIDFDVYNTEALAQLSEATRTEWLRAAGFPDDVARFLSRNFDVVDTLRGPMRIKECAFDYSAESGIEIDVELQDFVNLVSEGA